MEEINELCSARNTALAVLEYMRTQDNQDVIERLEKIICAFNDRLIALIEMQKDAVPPS